MLQIHTHRHIRFVRIEQAHAWLVVAILLETTGNETVAVSEPKVVKIIPKVNIKALNGTVAHQYALSAPQILSTSTVSIISPYLQNFFGFTNTDLITQLAARPPTIS